MSSYRQILKSTALVGGAQFVTLVVNIVRTKVLAVWLGTAGVGIAGLYSTGVSLVGVVAGLGLGTSGVRQIAESASSGDQERLARTVRTLRVTALVTSLVGTLVVVACAVPLSRASFGTAETIHVIGFVVVGVSLLFSGVSTAQLALLQGLRRLREMASAQILGTVLGSAAAIGVVYFLRDQGIAWYILVATLGSAFASWWYARRVKVEKPEMTGQDFSVELRGLLGMGIAFMTADLVRNATAYLSRVLVQHDLGLGAVGLYVATWNLSSQYVGMILGAMLADFAPRLTAVAKDLPATALWRLTPPARVRFSV